MITATLAILMRAFPGRALVRMTEAAHAIGMAGQTARNKLLSGTFPVQTITQGRQRLVKLTVLADYIDSLGTPIEGTLIPVPQDPPLVPARRPGRPKKGKSIGRAEMEARA